MRRDRFIQRFHANYIIDGTCWIWQRATNKQGYPSLKLIEGGRTWHNNQVPYILFNGPIADGMVVRHTCDTPSCVNPDHLVLGTQADNMRDMIARNRASKGAGSKGGCANAGSGKNHWQVGDKNTQAKLDWPTVRAVRADTDLTLHQLSDKYGISVSQCHRIRNNLSWVE